MSYLGLEELTATTPVTQPSGESLAKSTRAIRSRGGGKLVIAAVLAVATTTLHGVRWRQERTDASPHLMREAYSERGSKMRQWKEPCEEMFEFLAARSPGELLRMIVGGELSPPQLTFAAEHAGRSAPSEAVVSVLEPLLIHDLAYVREGAVYGLAQQGLPRARALLQRVSREDADPAVREAAADSLLG